MKHKHCCKECANSGRGEIEKIMECKLLTPEERVAIVHGRRIKAITVNHKYRREG